MLNFLKQVLHCDLQTGKKLERVLCPTTSFLPKKGCCLLIPMDHPKDIDTVQLRRQEVVVLGSSGATVSFSRRTVFSRAALHSEMLCCGAASADPNLPAAATVSW